MLNSCYLDAVVFITVIWFEHVHIAASVFEGGAKCAGNGKKGSWFVKSDLVSFLFFEISSSNGGVVRFEQHLALVGEGVFHWRRARSDPAIRLVNRPCALSSFRS